MRYFLWAAAVLVAASGCMTSKTNIHDPTFEWANVHQGKIVYHYADKTTSTETCPKESDWKLTASDERFHAALAGLSYEGELGWDLFGLTPRPFVAIRAAYLFDFGLAIGADENAAIFGVDWRYKDFVLGPLVGVPWTDPARQIWGGKIALTFQP
jgi:hypothetical protein